METVKGNPGVLDADCTVSALRPQDNVTDFVPVKVSTVEILELGPNQQVIQSGFYDQGYFDGANISYTSITGEPDALNLTVDQVPRGLQLNIIGQNAEEQDLLNYWIVLFTNKCNAFPVFEIGDVIGWTVAVGLDNPLAFFCPPASEAPTSSPAPSATMVSPTEAPISSQPTPCVAKSAAPYTSSAPVAEKTTEPTFYAPHSGKGSKGKGKGGTMRLRELNVWNDDIVATPAPTVCIEPEPPSPVSPSSKSKNKSSKQNSSAKMSAKKKDPSKSSPSKSKLHESKSSSAKGSSKSKHKTKHSSKGSSSKKSKVKAKSKANKVSPSKSKAKLHAKSSSKISAPTPAAIGTPGPSSSSPPPAPPTTTSPTSSNVQLPPSSPVAAPSDSTVVAPSSGINVDTPVQPTPAPTRFPTFEPTPATA